MLLSTGLYTSSVLGLKRDMGYEPMLPQWAREDLRGMRSADSVMGRYLRRWHVTLGSKLVKTNGKFQPYELQAAEAVTVRLVDSASASFRD